MTLSRRKFLSITAATSAAFASFPAGRLKAQANFTTNDATLFISKFKSAHMPLDFTGLSYEMPQLYNANYFSAVNTSLIKAYKDLSPSGVIRLGGNLSDVARWNGPNGDFTTPRQSAGVEHGKSYWEWKLTDPSVRANKDGAITPASIHNLRAFLDATNWRLIYGLNFGCGSPERAADEGAFVAEAMGDRLIAFQVGNEADFFAGNAWFRTKAYNYEEYLSGYKTFVAAVRAKVPNAPFSGPDTANNMAWVDNFATTQSRDVKFLSSHYYAMGPAKDPSKNAALLLAHNPLVDKQIVQVLKAVSHSDPGARGTGASIGFRMTEGNSCYGGGKPDVSDAFASSLWGADYMLTVAQAGYLGVNLHGGGNGIYTPIGVGENLSTELRPLYFGMQFAQRFAGFDLHACKLDTMANITAYAGTNDATGARQLALINKSDTSVRVGIPKDLAGKRPGRRMVLSAPSLEAKTGVRFAEDGRMVSDSVETVPAYAAILLTY